MSPEVFPVAPALRAQAIAARSYVWWQYENVTLPIDNSNSFQVYVPYRFDKLNLTAAPMEPDILTPCDPYRFRNEPQEMACDAIASRYYIATWDRDVPAFAQFSADVKGETNTSPDGYPYLISVEDPISTACDTHYDGHGVGMSQWGAARWARGDQCALSGNGNEDWSVQWTHAEQILFHYFTRVHLRDADNSNAILSPTWRWNPLDIRWEGINPQPPTMQVGQSYLVTVTVQNTSIYDWDCTWRADRPEPIPSYYVRYRWSKITSGQTADIIGSGQFPICNLAAGASRTVRLTLNDVPPIPGSYLVKFDLYERTDEFWFSDGGWPTYDVPVQIILSTPTPAPSPSPTPTPCGFDC
jgi:hypothetical protein